MPRPVDGTSCVKVGLQAGGEVLGGSPNIGWKTHEKGDKGQEESEEEGTALQRGAEEHAESSQAEAM